MTNSLAEVEAESIAYLVCAAAGLDAANYSVGYLANWSNGDEAVLRDTAARVIATASAVASCFTSPVRPTDDQASQGLHCPVQGSVHDRRQGAIFDFVDGSRSHSMSAARSVDDTDGWV